MAQASSSTQEVKKVDPKGSESVKKVEKVFVTVDKTFVEVLKSDQAGCMLIFSGEPSKFLRLTPEQYGQLSSQNRQRYAFALEEWEYLKEQGETEDLAARFDVDPGNVKSGTRLEITGKDAKFHYVWKRPENVRDFVAMGGEIVPASGSERTIGQNGEKRAHVVANKGIDELVLCRIPMETQRKLDERGRQGLKNLLDMGKREFGDLVKQAKAEVVESLED